MREVIHQPGAPLRDTQKNNECDSKSAIQRLDLNKEKHTAYYSALVEAWLDTRMEKDKSLLMLAAGGIGILVTL